MVDTMIYQKYVTTDYNGKALIYIKVLKSLYGLLKIVLLFTRILSNIRKLIDSVLILTLHEYQMKLQMGNR